MATLKPQKLIIEAFKEQASWISALLQPINFMFDDLRIAFQNNLTVSDNLYQEIKEITFKNETNSFPLRFKTKFNVYPKGLMLIYAYDKTTGVPAGINPSISWDFVNNEIKIASISSLTSGRSYTIRLLVIYG